VEHGRVEEFHLGRRDVFGGFEESGRVLVSVGERSDEEGLEGGEEGEVFGCEEGVGGRRARGGLVGFVAKRRKKGRKRRISL